jgi:hypothetical protein
MPATGKNLGCRLLAEFVDDASEKNQRFLAEGLAEALQGRVCASLEVTPWGGLRLTLSPEKSPLLAAQPTANLSVFEITTLGSTWGVETLDGTLACELAILQRALVGQRVVDWQLGTQLDLTMNFSNRTKFTVKPNPTAAQGWSLSMPDQYLLIQCNGQVQRATPRAGQKKAI